MKHMNRSILVFVEGKRTKVFNFHNESEEFITFTKQLIQKKYPGCSYVEAYSIEH